MRGVMVVLHGADVCVRGISATCASDAPSPTRARGIWHMLRNPRRGQLADRVHLHAFLSPDLLQADTPAMVFTHSCRGVGSLRQRFPVLLFQILVVAFLATSSTAVAGERGSATLPKPHAYQAPFEAETIDLPRAANGIDYRLYVRKPLREPRAGEKVVTVYVLDALWNFPAAATMLANAEYLGQLPPLLLVGVGYRDDADGGHEENRTRDYTPTAFAPADPKAHFLRPVGYEGSGGGPAFADVLEKQVIPYIEKTHSVDSARRVIVGKSMSGLAAAQILLTRPQLFTDYLLISPALWWDDYFKPFEQRAIARLETASHATKMTRPTQVYISAGDGEERLGMLADVYVFGRSLRLRNDKALDLKVQVLANEIHETAFAGGYTQGLRHVFRPRD